MLNLQRVLFCTAIDLDDIMHIDCLAYKYFVFYHFSLVDYNICYRVVCDYRDTPLQISPIYTYRLRAKKGPAPPPREFRRHILS